MEYFEGGSLNTQDNGLLGLSNDLDEASIAGELSCKSLYDATLPGELCYSDDDLTELEWLPNSVQDSVSTDIKAINSTTDCSALPVSSTNVPSSASMPLPKSEIDIPSSATSNVWKCLHCKTEKTLQWRNGPKGHKTLCNACGARYKSGQSMLNYRPAASSKFVLSHHSNSPQKYDDDDDDEELDSLSNYVQDSVSTDTTDINSTTTTISAIKVNSKRSRTAVARWTPTSSLKTKTVMSSPTTSHGKRCLHCETKKTPQWRNGPMGPKTLCNACGVRYRTGRLVPEYRPADSPTFVASKHSNLHQQVVKIRQHKELQE